MAVNHPGQGAASGIQRSKRAQAVATMQNTSISRGNFTVRGGGHIIIENGGLDVSGSANITGTMNVAGTMSVTGTANVTGVLTGDGDLNWYGVSRFYGPVNVGGNMATSGTLHVLGATTLDGAVTMNNTLTLGASGQITAGTVVINRFGSYGGQIVSTGSVLYLGAGASVIVGAEYLSTNKIAATDIEGFTLDILGAKSFKMPHPTKANHWLRHGSTESPVSGIEYWGEGTIGADGSVTVDLPDYFDALAKPDNRTVFVTGRGHSPDWSDIEGGRFTVTGVPGGRFSWLVKAERFGGDFLLEEELPVDESEVA